MLKSVEGVYRNGKIELLEQMIEPDGSRVVVTFLKPAGDVSLAERGIDLKLATELRSRLLSASEDWARPEMDVYDDV